MVKKIGIVILLGIVGLFQSIAGTTDTLFVDEDIQIVHLVDSVFVYVSWENSERFGRFPSNGLIIIKNGQAIMVDTPMDNEKTETLVRYLEDSLHVELTKLIIGHFHDDCLGGLEYIQSKQIESIAGKLTVDKCVELGLPVPSTSFVKSLELNLNGLNIECRFFGGGHSFDNITVWIPDKKVLFGGCLVKSMGSKGLGNLSDAVVNDWDTTVQNIIRHYADIEIVVPGHGSYGGSELLEHTIGLVEKHRAR